MTFELRYVADASRDDGVSLERLAENECTIFKGNDRFPWHLRFCYRSKLDGKLHDSSVPIFPNADSPEGKPGWGLKRAQGGWQVSPSILISTRRPDPNRPGEHIDIELWHETPLIVGVGEEERWHNPNGRGIHDGPFAVGPEIEPTPPERFTCVHGALPGACAFVGCEFFRLDGPRDEKWAFHPDTSQEDIDAALADGALSLKRHGGASPIHLVVEHYRTKRALDK